MHDSYPQTQTAQTPTRKNPAYPARPNDSQAQDESHGDLPQQPHAEKPC